MATPLDLLQYHNQEELKASLYEKYRGVKNIDDIERLPLPLLSMEDHLNFYMKMDQEMGYDEDPDYDPRRSAVFNLMTMKIWLDHLPKDVKEKDIPTNVDEYDDGKQPRGLQRMWLEYPEWTELLIEKFHPPPPKKRCACFSDYARCELEPGMYDLRVVCDNPELESRLRITIRKGKTRSSAIRSIGGRAANIYQGDTVIVESDVVPSGVWLEYKWRATLPTLVAEEDFPEIPQIGWDSLSESDLSESVLPLSESVPHQPGADGGAIAPELRPEPSAHASQHPSEPVVEGPEDDDDDD